MGLDRFFSFLIFVHSRQGSLDGGSTRHKAATCAQGKGKAIPVAGHEGP
jgi:hypothetical protein